MIEFILIIVLGVLLLSYLGVCAAHQRLDALDKHLNVNSNKLPLSDDK